MSAALLEIENLTKSFGGVHAVRNCTFSVPEGQVTGLIGPTAARAPWSTSCPGSGDQTPAAAGSPGNPSSANVPTSSPPRSDPTFETPRVANLTIWQRPAGAALVR